MANIAILYGGRSEEHEVSCLSAATVLKNLSPRHHAVLVGITREGRWHLQSFSRPFPEILGIDTSNRNFRLGIYPGEGMMFSSGEKLDVDVVIPVLHGSFGEDGKIQGLLEIAGLPYTGSGVLGSAVGMDKDMAKRLWIQAELPVVPWVTLYAQTNVAESCSTFRELFLQFGNPLFVKPSNAGSSVGISRVSNERELGVALKTAWLHGRKVLVEKAIIGREIECSVMGYSNPIAFPPGEIITLEKYPFYNYEAKYTDPEGAVLKVPANLDETTTLRIKSLAKKAYRVVEAGGFARVDFLLEKESQRIYINEINTIPGMTSMSLFHRMTVAGGVDFTTMLERFIDGALVEFSCKNRLSHEENKI